LGENLNILKNNITCVETTKAIWYYQINKLESFQSSTTFSKHIIPNIIQKKKNFDIMGDYQILKITTF